MRVLASFAILIAFAVSDGAWAERIRYHTTEETVRRACGKKLQENKEAGVIGCQKKCGKDNKNNCDLSCGGPEGKDCRVYEDEVKVQAQ